MPLLIPKEWLKINRIMINSKEIKINGIEETGSEF
jgi:hypothetical protein